MRAIALESSGAKPALLNLPDPEAGPGEVLVRVRASSVNGFDVAVAAGYLEGMMEHRYPVVLGKDFAGIVEAVGGDASGFSVGDRVFGVVMKPVLGDGGFGELVAVNEQFGVTRLPEAVDLQTAGALGLAGTTAADAVDALALKPGDTVLVSGATGGVGALAVQYAAATGARVVATARPGEETDFVRGLGAQDVVDRDRDLAPQVTAIAPGGVTAVVHLAGDGAVLVGILAADGRLASALGFGPDQDARAIPIMASPAPATLDRLAADVAARRLTVPVSRRYPLADVPAALTDFASGKVGKLAVDVG